MSNAKVLHGNCVELMRGMPDNSVDAIVTDPPYELTGNSGGGGFMGKAWDASGIAYSVEMWGEALRVLKPGGHLLAFGGTRTYHRMACAIEDAGFEIRDSIHWVYGSGFPKSLDVSKAIDKAAGAVRNDRVVSEPGTNKVFQPTQRVISAGTPVTEEAQKWEGWGTALKPAHEPVVVARKPLVGTVAKNVLEWGVGGLNIEGCRVPTDDNLNGGGYSGDVSREASGATSYAIKRGGIGDFVQPSGRWPANVVFDRAAGEALDRQSGEASYNPKGTFGRQQTDQRRDTPAAFAMRKAGDGVFGYGDRGGASRFFNQADWSEDDWPFVYQAKPSKKERNAGLDGLDDRPRPVHIQQLEGVRESKGLEKFGDQTTKNNHPTVKPVALMRHLVRLVTPPDGTVLDPFSGSGTTLVAAVLEGVNAIGCEMTDEYLPIIEGRIAWAQEQVDGPRQPKVEIPTAKTEENRGDTKALPTLFNIA